MSYDLNFWKYERGVRLDHQSVYERLCDGEEVTGLAELPIDKILERVKEVFGEWEQLDDVTFEGGDAGTFQLYTTKQYFRIDCYGMDGDHMNRFIDIANEYECPLYDPQVGQRFDNE